MQFHQRSNYKPIGYLFLRSLSRMMYRNPNTSAKNSETCSSQPFDTPIETGNKCGNLPEPSQAQPQAEPASPVCMENKVEDKRIYENSQSKYRFVTQDGNFIDETELFFNFKNGNAGIGESVECKLSGDFDFKE